MILFLAGLFLSLSGSLPPGIISLSVAQTAIHRGVVAGIILGAGASFAEFFQAWFSVAMADWFLAHPAVANGFKWAAVPVFMVLAVYMFYFAKPPRVQGESVDLPVVKTFIKGMIISVFNLLAIPYWFAYCGWLKMQGWWEEGPFAAQIFSLGVVVGTMAALIVYAWLGREIVKRSDKAAQVANRVVGLIFFGLALKVIWDLLMG